MTTVCTDGKTIACDTRVSSSNGGVYPARITKIHRVDDRFIGHCGDLWQGHMYLRYLIDGKPPEKKLKDFNAIILDKDGTIYHVDPTLNELELTGPFAIGSGMDCALGAMAAGATPAEAVMIASRYDIYTASEVLVYHVRELKKKEKKAKDGS